MKWLASVTTLPQPRIRQLVWMGLGSALIISGALIAPDTLEVEIANRAPVLLAHGEADGQVPVTRSRDAEALLLKLGVPVETAYSAGLGHGIDDHGIAMGALALQRGFA